VASLTQTVDAAGGRVLLGVAGGRPNSAFYLFRRDPSGTTQVRDTSDGTAIFGAGTTVRTNWCPTPKWLAAGNVGAWQTLVGGTAQTLTLYSPSGAFVGFGLQSASLPTGASNFAGAYITAAAAAGQAWALSTSAWAVTLPAGAKASLRIEFLSSTGTVLQNTTATGWTDGSTSTSRTLTAIAPANTVTVRAFITLVGGTTAGAAEVRWNRVLLEQVGTFGTYFDGDTADVTTPGAERYASWVGTRNASASLLTTAGAGVTIADYEAQQGMSVVYLLTDTNGTQLASAAGTVPLWGTWLKSPGRPFQNVRVPLASVGDVTYAGRSEVLQVEGSPYPVELHDLRQSASGQVSIVTLTAAAATAVRQLISEGGVLLLDCTPAWGVPFEYVTVGDVKERRPYGDGSDGLHLAARVFDLPVTSVRPPVGRSEVSAGASYSQLPTLYPTYAAMAATVPTYNALVTG
jgi:hypothetical protein